MFHEQIAQRLSKHQRDMLVEHIDGKLFVPVPVTLRNPARNRSTLALIDAKLIRYSGHWRSDHNRPQSTRITDDGRQVLAIILAQYAEALIRAGHARQQVPGASSPLSTSLILVS